MNRLDKFKEILDEYDKRKPLPDDVIDLKYWVDKLGEEYQDALLKLSLPALEKMKMAEAAIKTNLVSFSADEHTRDYYKDLKKHLEKEPEKIAEFAEHTRNIYNGFQ